MKKVLLSAIIIISLISCRKPMNDPNDNRESKRIIPKESASYKSVRFIIVEVDGKEYFTTSRGGIIPLETKKATNEK